MPQVFASPASGARRRVGLIVNPIAGMGGSVALRGTDGAALEEARRRGAAPIAAARAARTLAGLALPAETECLAAGGAMGADVARAHGLRPRAVTEPAETTSAADTRAAASAMLAAGAELILFAGGDGTARDVFAATGGEVPLLGIPTGVKMHSAVFATTPENAGRVAADFLSGVGTRMRDAEIVDIDEELLRRGTVATRLHGVARVPYQRARVQHAKIGARDPEAELDAACADVAAGLEPGCVHLFGPGSTTQRVMASLGLGGTLLGVDAVLDGRSIGSDLSEPDILRLTEGRPARIVVGVVGGQGFLFGRGNQQLSAAVIRRVGRDRITVIAGLDKLAALDGGALFVDTGDLATDAMLRGYVRVQTGPARTAICRVLS